MGLLDVLGTLASPLGNLAGGAISGITSLVSGNKQAQAQREANQLNYKMFKEQLGFTEDMWNKQNAYNTPAMQRERYEQAGINPYFALGNINGGNAESVSTPAAQAAVPVDAYGKAIGEAGQSFGNAVSSAVGAYQQQMMLNEQIAGQQEANKAMMIKNRFAVAHENNQIQREWYELSNLVKSGKLTDEQIAETNQRMRKLKRESAMLDIDLKYYDDYLSSRNRQSREQAEFARQQARKAALDAELQQMVNDAFPAMNDAQLRVLAGQASAAFASADLSRKQGKKVEVETEREKIKKLGDILANGISANQYTLQNLGMSKAELDALRNGTVLESLKGSKFALFMDYLFKYGSDIMPSIPIGFMVGK